MTTHRLAALAVTVVAGAGIAGCGGGSDAPSSDARGDAVAGDGRGVDARTGPVTVVVHDDAGQPAAGIAVVLHTGAGDPIGTFTTDAAGTCVLADTPAGAMVTILRRQEKAPQYELFTVIEVEPGDRIELGTPDAPPGETLDVRVSYPGAFAGADSYLSDFGCRRFGVMDPGVVVTQSISTACLGGDGDLAALAMARQGTTPIAYASVKDVVPAGNGPTPIAIPGWTAATVLDVGVANLAAEVTDTSIDLRPVLDGMVLAPAPEGTGGVVAPPGSLVDGWYARVLLTAFAPTTVRIWSWRQVLPATITSPHALDFADFGPRFETVHADTTDAARPTATWTTSAPVTSYNAIAMRLHWDDPATAPETNHSWVIVVPSDRATITYPALPAAVAAYAPSATSAYLHYQVFALWHEEHATYAAFRNARPFALGTALLVPTTGAARMLYLQEEAH